MPIDDELEKSSLAAEIREESERTIQGILTSSGMAGALSLIPFGVGSTINQMLTELAFRRTNDRMKRMLDEMTQHIRELGEKKIDREWFKGEEFQSLLFEALHQLHMTESAEKIKMLGNALANSGATEFAKETRKAIFLRLIRELSPQHIGMLRFLMPNNRYPKPTPKDYPYQRLWNERLETTGQGEGLLILQMLAGNGLVEERLKSIDIRTESRFGGQGTPERQLSEYLKQLEQPPLRKFRLSELGSDFIKFVGADAMPDV